MYVKSGYLRHLMNEAVTCTDGADKGIIPLTCSELFDRVEKKKAADPNVSFTVEVSYIEVCRYFYAYVGRSNLLGLDL